MATTKILNVQDHNGNRITGVGTPTATTDAVTKAYVDAKKRGVILKMCSADYTPTGVGVDNGGTVMVPYDPVGGGSLAFTVVSLVFRCETTGSTGSSLKIQRSTGTGVFTNAGYLNTTASTIAASAYEASATTFAVTTVNSGDKLKPEYTALGTSAAGFTVYLVLVEQ